MPQQLSIFLKKFLCFNLCAMTSLIYAQDIEYTDEFKRLIIERSTQLEDQSGRAIILSQRFLRIGQSLLYIKGSSTAETIRYGQEFCIKQGKIFDLEYGTKIIEITRPDQNMNEQDRQSELNLISCNPDHSFIENIQQKAGLQKAIKQEMKGGYHYTSWYNGRGEKLIERKVVMTTPNGTEYSTQKRFLGLGTNQMMYLPNSASAETLEYEQAFCGSFALTRDIDKGVQIESISSSYGLMCDSSVQQ